MKLLIKIMLQAKITLSPIADIKADISYTTILFLRNP